MGKKGFNKDAKTKGDKYNYPAADSSDKITITHHKHPIFCLKHLHRLHCLEQCDESEKAALIDRMAVLSGMTWEQIQNTQRHGFGTEKIARSSIRPALPSFITDDVSYLLAARFDGHKPFLFHRDRFICHIIYIDNRFSVYQH